MRLHDHRYNVARFQRILGPLLTSIVFVILAVAGAVNLSRMVAESGPTVGDIVSFTPNGSATPAPGAELSVTRADGSTCRLDIPLLQRQGGSLVVEERNPGTRRIYRARWSGGGTSAGALDCGREADLAMGENELEILALAAGGFGPVHRASHPR